MRHIKFIALLSIILIATLTSCREAPTNGDLDAQWQLTSITINSTGETIEPDGKYFCIYRELIQLSNGGSIITTGCLAVKDNIMSIDFPMITSPEEIERLASWGIGTNKPSFEIVSLNSRHMVLKSDYSTITLRCF